MAKVKKGDTVSGIAAKAGVSVAAIAAANPQIKNLGKISVGQTINIPKVDTNVKTSGNTYAGGVTGGKNPFATGSGTSASTLAGINAASGFKGATGPTGPTGATGPTGSTGPTGGDTGEDGTEEKDGTDDSTTNALLQALLAGQQTAAANAAAAALAERQSAYDILMSEFSRYGLQSLVEPLKGFIVSGSSPAELTIQLQNSKAYQDRFKANADRISKGLAALSPAEYIAMEDQYQNIMRNYGLPASYYSKDTMGTQVGFQTLLANDVSATELEDRVLTAQNRVLNANPEVAATLKTFYPDITNGDILAYALDPTKALEGIKRKVTAAEIGGAAVAAGLTTAASRAEQLAAAGVTKSIAQQQYGTVAELAERGSQLADIYKQQPYGQDQAEAEVFNISGQTEAAKQRKKITSLEQAEFSGSSGAAQGALSRERVNAAGAV